MCSISETTSFDLAETMPQVKKSHLPFLGHFHEIHLNLSQPLDVGWLILTTVIKRNEAFFTITCMIILALINAYHTLSRTVIINLQFVF